MDALSEILRLANLTGAVLADVTSAGGWGVSVPAASATRYAHVVLEGDCLLRAGDREIALRSGDTAIVFAGGAHTVSGAPATSHATPLASLLRPVVAGELAPVSVGSGGPRARWVTFTFSLDRHLGAPLLDAMPEALALSLRGSSALTWMGESLGLSLSLTDAPRAGAAAVLARVAELAFIEAVRRHVESLPAGGTGWLAGLSDRHVGATLALLHGQPGENWTVERLARQVGISRSALGDHFSAIVGEPVMGFLARVRLQRAAHELLAGGKAIKTIAKEAGYESPQSFARAFKRAYRLPPSRSAKRQRARRNA